MRRFLKTTLGKICVSCLAAVLLVMLGLGGYTLWHYLQPKFHDVTIELGENAPELHRFLTEYADPARVNQLTPFGDLTSGIHPLSFSHNGKVETVNLYVVDTTPPTATFRDITTDIHTPLDPNAFVAEHFDLSPVTVTFSEMPVAAKAEGDLTVAVEVTDAAGNTVTGVCAVYYLVIRDSFTLELGQTVTRDDLLLNPEKDSHLLDQQQLDFLNTSPVGVYTITAGDAACTVTVQDTTPPVLELQDVCVDRYAKIKKDAFVVKAEDISGEVTVTLLTKLSSKTVGTFPVEFEAVDINGNKTVSKTTLKVTNDSTPPVFSGLKDMSVPKGSTPNYKSGVKATDAKDGAVSFTYDDSKVDLSKAGTYYVSYTASDTSGNTVTKRRKITVTHNAEDTAELVASVAAKVGDDVISLRNYVRSNIRYSTSWGGEDPVWYGFKNRTGNCYVHAKCLDALLKAKGYETMLIWVTDRSHYWNLVKIDGKWRHIDSTPGSRHSVYYNPMTDEERYSCLQGRDWDRSKWPECN